MEIGLSLSRAHYEAKENNAPIKQAIIEIIYGVAFQYSRARVAKQISDYARQKNE